MTSRVAFVTAGDVGGGHVARGLAIARALERAGAAIDLRVFSRRMPFPSVEADARFSFVDLDAGELADPLRARNSALARALAAYAPDLVIVDFFWAALAHVPLGGAEAWLLLRWHPTGWLGGAGRRLDRSAYRRVIAIEPIAAGDDRVEPIVSANPEELVAADAARERLGFGAGERGVLLAHTGAPGERERLGALASEVGAGGRIVQVGLFDEGAPFPLAPWLAGADVIVGGGGYNLFWETRWLGLASRAHLVPFARGVDDQHARLRACADHAMRANGADQLAASIARG